MSQQPQTSWTIDPIYVSPYALLRALIGSSQKECLEHADESEEEKFGSTSKMFELLFIFRTAKDELHYCCRIMIL